MSLWFERVQRPDRVNLFYGGLGLSVVVFMFSTSVVAGSALPALIPPYKILFGLAMTGSFVGASYRRGPRRWIVLGSWASAAALMFLGAVCAILWREDRWLRLGLSLLFAIPSLLILCALVYLERQAIAEAPGA